MTKKIKLLIVDYGVGNFRNVQKAFEAVGVAAVISDQADDIPLAEAIALPGVGAFGDAIDNLRERGMEEPLIAAAQAGAPFFGICVGMQLLFEQSNEMGRHRGLGLLAGHVTRFPQGLTVPHMGWNQVEPVRDHPLLREIKHGDFAYFAHSYNCVPQRRDDIVACTDYGGPFVSIVARDNICGIQFHPEKSQRVGLQILKSFAQLVIDS